MNSHNLRDSISNILRVARVLAPAAVLASGLTGPAALGKPGDLDPSFGDVGRVFPLQGTDPAWSIELQDDDVIVAGGIFGSSYYNYEAFATGFTRRLSSGGSIDQTFAALSLAETEVFDVAVQSDGKVVGVGRTVQATGGQTVLTLFRLDRDGALDPGFGDGGIVHLGVGDAGDFGGTSVVLDPDGGIVVAGMQGTWAGPLIVARYLVDGTLDTTFGTGGIFTGPVVHAEVARPRIVRTGDGRYRITLTSHRDSDPELYYYNCSVLGLTAQGGIDATFGTNGVAGVDAGPGSVTCSSLATQSSDRLLVAGSNSGHGVLVRLVATGAQDDSFSAPMVGAQMTEVTAIGVGSSDSILAAGRVAPGVSGALVARLQADGQLDALYGNAGTSWIDLPSVGPTTPVVNDMAVLTGGGALLAGGAFGYDYGPFVARLVGTGGGDSPGVLGIERGWVETSEQGQSAVVTVRRMGGGAGEVSVAYATGPGWSPTATSQADYTPTSGRLTWADGDASDKQINVPIISDDVYEGQEYFAVALSDVLGGAGLGTRTATITIAPDPGYLGRLAIDGPGTIHVNEGVRYAPVFVRRDDSAQGAVSVTLTLNPGTATAGADYQADPVTLSWADGSAETKMARIPIIDDAIHESMESFTVTLTNQTTGATLAASTATINIADNDRSSSGGRGGGGSFGFASWLLLGAAGAVRYLRVRRPAT